MKLHRCPECGREHTGLTETCGDCLNQGRDVNPQPRTTYVTAGANNVTRERTVTPSKPSPRPKGLRRGRPRQYRNAAERQKAYRQRQGGRQ